MHFKQLAKKLEMIYDDVLLRNLLSENVRVTRKILPNYMDVHVHVERNEIAKVQ